MKFENIGMIVNQEQNHYVRRIKNLPFKVHFNTHPKDLLMRSLFNKRDIF